MKLSKRLPDIMQKLAEEKGPDLARALIEIALDKTAPTTLRISAAKEVFPFLMPRLASTELAIETPTRPAREWDNAVMRNPRLRTAMENLQSEMVRAKQEAHLSAQGQ